MAAASTDAETKPGAARAEVEARAPEEAGHHLLAWSKELQRAQSYEELVDAAGREVERLAGYRHVWLYVMDANGKTATLIAGRDSETGARRPSVAQLPIEGDAMIDELLRTEQAVVVDDARTDPRTNKEIVERMGNRTIINVPLTVLEERLGAFGLGTIGDEGCRSPTPAELDYITAMASHLAVAVDRVRALAERDVAMREQQRLQARVLRAEKLEGIGLLAGSVAHDVNNLMTVVLVSLDRALLAVDRDGAAPALEDIRAAATRARDLANRMLALSGKGSFPTRAVSLRQTAVEMASDLRSFLPSGVRLSPPGPSDEMAWVDVEREQLGQMVRNLVLNARDAIGDRSGTIELRTLRVDEIPPDDDATAAGCSEGPYAVLQVVDSGAGMDKATRAQLFEPFFTTRGPGRGLGLAVVLGIVRGHQGAVRFTSDPEGGSVVGTKVEVFLPLREAPPAEPRPSRDAAAIASDASPTVLLVDDDHRVRLTTMLLLKHRGYRVIEAASGEEALRTMADDDVPTRLVMLDLNMPSMSGREVYRRMREARPGLPILLCSGYDAGSLEALELRGPTEFLQKPYDLSSLTAALEALLARVRQ